MEEKEILGKKMAAITNFIYNTDGTVLVEKVNTSFSNRVIELIYTNESTNQFSMWDILSDAIKKLKTLNFNITIVPCSEGTSVGFLTGAFYLVPPTKGTDLFYLLLDQIHDLILKISVDEEENNAN